MRFGQSRDTRPQLATRASTSHLGRDASRLRWPRLVGFACCASVIIAGSQAVWPVGNCLHGTDHTKAYIPQKSAVYGMGLHSLRLGPAHSPHTTIRE